jgi:hypothetical protein
MQLDLSNVNYELLCAVIETAERPMLKVIADNIFKQRKCFALLTYNKLIRLIGQRLVKLGPPPVWDTLVQKEEAEPGLAELANRIAQVKVLLKLSGVLKTRHIEYSPLHLVSLQHMILKTNRVI